MDFGTGVVMICTFGDEQDIRWQQKYSLDILKVVDEHGNIINSGKYSKLKISKAREKIISDLKNAGLHPVVHGMLHNSLHSFQLGNYYHLAI